MTPALLTAAVIGFVLQVTVLVFMIRLKLRNQFPAFFTYIAFNCISSVVIQVTLRWFLPEFPAVYWAVAAVSMLLGFWIFYEVFVTIFKAYEGLLDFGKLLFRWALVFLFVGGLVTALSTSGSHISKVCNTIFLLEHCIQLMQCGMLFLLLTFESRLGLSWRTHAMCIGLGIGVFAAWDLTMTYIGNSFHSQQPMFDVMNSVVSIGCYAYWLLALALPEPSRKNVLDSPSRLIFQRWNEALMATPLVARKSHLAFAPVESFLPGVEQTVERVMARKMMN